MISSATALRENPAERLSNQAPPHPLEGTRETQPEAVVAAELPAGIEQLLALLRGDLQGIEFPGFGAAALEQATVSLDGHVHAVKLARAELARAEAELGAAREALLALAEQGLGYLRVYARGRSELIEKLSAITLEPVARMPTRRRKPRKPRGSSRPMQGPPQEASG